MPYKNPADPAVIARTRAANLQHMRKRIADRFAAGVCNDCAIPLDPADVGSRPRSSTKTARCRACLDKAAKRLRDNGMYKVYNLQVAARKRAKMAGVAFDLDKDWIKKKLAGRCELTGLAFASEVEDTDGFHMHPFAPSLDRIEAGGPYTKDNTRMVIWAMNAGLGNWGEKTFRQVAQAYLARAA